VPNPSNIDSENFSALAFFPAGVPAGTIFEMNLDEIETILDDPKDKYRGITPELCYIGLVSYFEAFSKDHAASLVNLVPALIENLRNANYDVKVEALKALELGAMFPQRIGSMIMENYDFGSAKRINAIYNTLIKITPFSKDEIKRYDEIFTCSSRRHLHVEIHLANGI